MRSWLPFSAVLWLAEGGHSRPSSGPWGVRHGGRSGPAVAPQAQDTLCGGMGGMGGGLGQSAVWAAGWIRRSARRRLRLLQERRRSRTSGATQASRVKAGEVGDSTGDPMIFCTARHVNVCSREKEGERVGTEAIMWYATIPEQGQGPKQVQAHPAATAQHCSSCSLAYSFTNGAGLSPSAAAAATAPVSPVRPFNANFMIFNTRCINFQYKIHQF